MEAGAGAELLVGCWQGLWESAEARCAANVRMAAASAAARLGAIEFKWRTVLNDGSTKREHPLTSRWKFPLARVLSLLFTN